MSAFAKRGARYFLIMGVIIILATFYQMSQIPWNDLQRLGVGWLGQQLALGFIIQLSIGLTEIAVAWLIGKHLE